MIEGPAAALLSSSTAPSSDMSMGVLVLMVVATAPAKLAFIGLRMLLCCHDPVLLMLPFGAVEKTAAELALTGGSVEDTLLVLH